jgi:hypothetical protein
VFGGFFFPVGLLRRSSWQRAHSPKRKLSAISYQTTVFPRRVQSTQIGHQGSALRVTLSF